MSSHSPIPSPPPELVLEWKRTAPHPSNEREHYHYITLCAAQWGADQELEACCAWLPKLPPWSADDLRRHRRPKPPTLKKQALETLRSMQIDPVVINGVNVNAEVMAKYDTIRRALEALDD